MKTKFTRLLAALILLTLSTLNYQLCTALAQGFPLGTAFTYQGRLNDSGSPANGSYDLSFSLYTVSSGGSAAAGPLTNNATAVSNGLFTTTLDFGAGVFNGASYWLEIGVQTNGGNGFATLAPRQPVTPTPYAIFAENSGGVNSGSISASQFNTPGAPASGQVLEFNGSSLQWTTPSGGSSGWNLTGNSSTIPGVDFLGTRDNEPLELWVNGVRALRLEPDLSGSYGPSVIGGAANNTSYGFTGVTIGGGYGNAVGGPQGTIAGGRFNSAGGAATIGGGVNNNASGNYATIGGGRFNTNTATAATIAGGAFNLASGQGATVSGGGYDGVHDFATGANLASGSASVVGGGLLNNASAAYATVPGGSNNLASGNSSFAAGNQAQALHPGAFVWSDVEGTPFTSTTTNQFSVRANGGVRFMTGGVGMTVDGVAVGAGGGGGVGSYNGNTASGSAALNAITSGNDNTADGDFALYFDTIGSGNTGTGFEVLYYNSIGDGNTANGYQALLNNISSFNTADGYQALYSNIDGYDNTADGAYALYSNTNGFDNTAIGINALTSNTDGIGNTGTGHYVLGSNTGGFYNTADGFSALDNNTTGGNNTATGFDALSSNTTGNGNTAIGVNALLNNLFDHADNNTAIGVAALSRNAGGSNNIALGYGAGSLIESNNNIDIGNNGVNTDNNVIRIGTSQTATYLVGTVWASSSGGDSNPQMAIDQGNTGDYARLRLTVGGDTAQRWEIAANQTSFLVYSAQFGANMLQLDGTGLTVDGTFVSSSDRNAKENFQPVDAREVLAKVAALPVSRWNYKRDATSEHIGPMAQDFYSAFNVGPDDKHITTIDEGGVALAAIQGLNQKLEQKETEITELKQRLDKLEQLMSQNNGGLK